MKLETKFGIIIVSLFILGIGLIFYLNATDFMFVKGDNFCEKKGFDRVSISGSYSEKFGKVKCVSCYDRECKYKEFNVTKKFGIIVEEKQNN